VPIIPGIARAAANGDSPIIDAPSVEPAPATDAEEPPGEFAQSTDPVPQPIKSLVPPLPLEATSAAQGVFGPVSSGSCTERKWWEDSDDPLYFIVCSSSVTLGRPCDADDQVRGLCVEIVQGARS
jgi:hypothetical protein